MLKIWNKETCGQLHANILAAEELLNNCHLAHDSSPSPKLLLDLNNAKCSLHNRWPKVEETHWRQKAKTKWLQEGDRSTNIFHLSAKVRRHFNRIDKISVDGALLEDSSLIKQKAVEFFSNLLKAYPEVPSDSLFQLAGPSLSKAENGRLINVPSDLEIREAVFSLKKESSLGPDGVLRFVFHLLLEHHCF